MDFRPSLDFNVFQPRAPRCLSPLEAARRTFLVLTVGQVPEVLIAELQAEGLEVRSVRTLEGPPSNHDITPPLANMHFL